MGAERMGEGAERGVAEGGGAERGVGEGGDKPKEERERRVRRRAEKGCAGRSGDAVAGGPNAPGTAIQALMYLIRD